MRNAIGTARIAGIALALAAGVAGALLVSPDAGAERAGKDGAAELAANAFLKSLPAELRKQASYPLDSTERTAWNFVPMTRGGVSLLSLDDRQSELLGPLLATALGPEG